MPIVGVTDRRLGVPLPQLGPVKPDEPTRPAIEDWRYWLPRGYTFSVSG